MTLKRTKRPFDPAKPPEGVRLEIGSIATEYGLSISDMAVAAEISRTAMFSLVAENRWPVRNDREAIAQRLRDLFVQAGATPDQIEQLFWAHVGKRADHNTVTDGHGEPKAGPLWQPPEADPKAEPINEKDTDMLLPKQSLTPQARKHFQLFVNPFEGDVTTDEQMFSSSEIAYVREACWQAVIGARFVAVVGESGAGKTTIQADLESRIERDRKQCIVIRPSVLGMEDSDAKGKTLKSADILAAIITALDPLGSVPQTLQARTTRVERLLARSTEAGFQHLLLIEEAHCLPDNTLKHLKRLHEAMRFGRKPVLGILLLAQPELALKLDPRRANLREVTQRCEVVQLLPLEGDLQSYLEHRAKAAGFEFTRFFDAGGVEEIRARLTVQRPSANGKTRTTSLTYPLAVNNLVTAAMNCAAELGVPVITRDVVRAI